MRHASITTDTAVLVTELTTPTGTVRITDALALRHGADLTDDADAGRQELIRSAVVLDGTVRLTVDIQPRGGATASPPAAGISIHAWRRPDLNLHVRATRNLDSLTSTHELHTGEQLDVVLSWSGAHRRHCFTAQEQLSATTTSWRNWVGNLTYEGLEKPLVTRSAITLKLCDHWSNGALFAAPTSSLPAPIGGVRNWDYRFSEIADDRMDAA